MGVVTCDENEDIFPNTNAPETPPPFHQLGKDILPEPTLQVRGMEVVYDDDSAQEDTQQSFTDRSAPTGETSCPASTAAPSNDNGMVTISIHPPTNHHSERIEDADIQAGTLLRSRWLIMIASEMHCSKVFIAHSSVLHHLKKVSVSSLVLIRSQAN